MVDNFSKVLKEAEFISECMLDKKALNIVIIDVHNLTTLTDIFVICTSESQPQTKAIADHISRKMRSKGLRALHSEGYESLDWVLIDYVNIVIHIFSQESRDFYDMERLWADGKIVEIQDIR